ncbi:MAG: SxtJ family membrane protein, partial [Candidatus Rokuibacteriota bacterium]
VVAAIFLTLALVRPRTLAPLNRLWLRLGLVLHACISPVILGLLFYGTVAPIGLLLRLFGKDVLRLRFEPASPTYWIERRPPGPAPDTMPRQF